MAKLRLQCKLAVSHFRRRPCIWFAAERGHVSRVTVIPLESDSASSTVEADAVRNLIAQTTSDPEKVEHIHNALLPAEKFADASKTGLLNSLRALQLLNEHSTSTTAPELDMYWDALESFEEDQVRCLLPSDLAEVFTILANCNRRCPELVRLLNQQCRRLARSFSAEDAAMVVRAYGKMGWRSTKSVSAFAQRIVFLLQKPESALTVKASHLRIMVSVYPQLDIPLKKDKVGDLALWKAVAAAVPSRLDSMEARDFAVILNTYAKIGFSFTAVHRNVMRMFEACAMHLAPRIASTGISSGDGFSTRNIALIANSYARIRAGPYVLPLMQAVSTTVIPEIGTCTHQDVANILNAFAKLNTSDVSMFESAALVITQDANNYSPQSLANVAHAYARQDVRHVAVFDCIAQNAVRLLDKFKPQELSNIAYAYGRLQIQSRALFSGMKDEVIYRGTVGKSLRDVSPLYNFSLQATEQITQAYARLQIRDQRLYFVLFDMARQRARELAKSRTNLMQSDSKGKGNIDGPERSKAEIMSAWSEEPETLDGRALSTLLSSFAAMQVNFHSLIRWAPTQIQGLHGQYTTWQLANFFSACSRLGIKHRPMYQELIRHAKARVSQISPKGVAMMIRAMSRARHYNRYLMRQAVKTVGPRLKDLDITDIEWLLTGCAELRYRDERFLRLLGAVARSRLGEMNTKQLSLIVAAYAQLRISHHKWFDEMLFELFRRQHELNEQDATNAVYAMSLIAAAELQGAKAQVTRTSSPMESVYPFTQHPGIVNALLGVTNKNRKKMNYSAVFQLQLIELFLRLIVPGVYKELHHESKVLLAKARKVNLVVDDYMANSSLLHRTVSQWFTRVGLHHRSEVFVGPFMLDMLVGERVVIEVDGPTHFYRDTNSRTSASILKRFILLAMGFYVKHLPYQEWRQCGTVEKKMLYCASFWRDVLAAQSQAQDGDPARLPPLVDVIDMVISAQEQADQDKELLPEAEEGALTVVGGKAPADALPAFYSDDADIPPGEADDEDSPGPYDIDAESSGARTVQELLDAHQAAEDELTGDRARSISARQRLRMESKRQSRTSAADEWEQEYMDVASTSKRKSAVVDSAAEAGFSGGSAPSKRSLKVAEFHGDAIQAQMKALLPRSKRTEVHHSGGGIFDHHTLEEETDSSDDEAIVGGAGSWANAAHTKALPVARTSVQK